MQTHLSCCAKDEAARMPRPASWALYTLHFAFQFILLMFLCCCCSRRCCVALPCFVSKDFALVCIKISLCCLPPLKTAMPECRCQKRGGKRGLAGSWLSIFANTASECFPQLRLLHKFSPVFQTKLHLL